MLSKHAKARWDLLHDEARILIFDDPADENEWQRPGYRSNTDFIY